MTGLLVALGTLLVAAAIGLAWRSRDGRIRQRPRRSAAHAGADAAAEAAGKALPEPVRRLLPDGVAVTLLQLSTPICARCPQARAVLTGVAAATPGVGFAELDLARYPELAGELGVRSTPTTLVIARPGHELFRVTGVPARAELVAALRSHL